MPGGSFQAYYWPCAGFASPSDPLAFLLGCDRPKPPNEPPKTVTYYQNIAPIISTQCLTCHHPNGSAPFSLASFEDAKKHAAQIVKVNNENLAQLDGVVRYVRARVRPPTHPYTRPDGSVSRSVGLRPSGVQGDAPNDLTWSQLGEGS